MSIYVDFNKLMSYNGLINVVLGDRGCGKSFGSKKMVLNNYLKTGEQFLYLRRYKTELDSALVTFWDDLQANGYFKDHELKVKKSKMLTTFMCDGEICGYAAPLSTSNILKSTAFPLVKTIIYDEFILDAEAGTYRYLRNEPQLLLDTIETVFRLREGRVLMLGNFINFFGCPLISYFDLDLPYNSEFRTFKDGAIVVYCIKNPEYQKVKSNTRFGRLIEGTVYGDYAIGNKSLRENSAFIKKRPANCKFYTHLVLNGNDYGVWKGMDGYLYISEKFDPSSKMIFACDFDDHTEQTIFLNLRENFLLKHCLKAYKQGWLKFENLRIKGEIVRLFNKCISI